jgi:GTPase
MTKLDLAQSEPSNTANSPSVKPVEPITRSGYVAIIGRPNVGKSTLLNRLVKAKVSITSGKPQTTRHRILGLQEAHGTQFAFIDTPGYQTRQTGALNRVLNRTVKQVLPDADVIVLVCETHQWTKGDDELLALLPTNKPVVLALNKIDEHKNLSVQMQMAASVSAKFSFAEVMPISGEKGQGVDTLLQTLAKYLPEGERLYEADQLSDRSDKFLAAEVIREKLFRLTGDELPYTSTVVIEEYVEEGRLKRIRATILVQRDAHKAMVLGAQGAKIKRIASESRVDLEKMFDCKVYLEVWIKVKSGWADSEASLRAYGYE